MAKKPDKKSKDRIEAERQEPIEEISPMELYYSLSIGYGDYAEDLEPQREGTEDHDDEYLGLVMLH